MRHRGILFLIFLFILTSCDSNSKIDFIERRKELCFEGHRRMDLLRNNLKIRPDGAAFSAPGIDKIIFPIPGDETTNNPNVTQNPGSF